VYAIFLQIIFQAFLTIAYYKCRNSSLPLCTVSLKIEVSPLLLHLSMAAILHRKTASAEHTMTATMLRDIIKETQQPLLI